MNRIRKAQAHQESGFTLIELLIVIVILGVLAGIAIFAAENFTGDAEDVCAEANARIEATVDAATDAGGSGTYTSQDAGDCTA